MVRKGMGHGELTPEVFTQVWEECYKEVRVVGVLCARVCVCAWMLERVCVCWCIGTNMSYRFTVLVMEVQCCLSCVVFLRHSCLLCYPSSAGPLTGAVRAQPESLHKGFHGQHQGQTGGDGEETQCTCVNICMYVRTYVYAVFTYVHLYVCVYVCMCEDVCMAYIHTYVCDAQNQLLIFVLT